MTHRGRIGLAYGFVSLLLALTSFSALAEKRAVNEADIWTMIIHDSIVSYPRSCPCPYSADRSGRRCGDRSAYTRSGATALICYPQDIPDEQITRYRERYQ
jgi:hypothetical protein